MKIQLNNEQLEATIDSVSEKLEATEDKTSERAAVLESSLKTLLKEQMRRAGEISGNA